MFFSVTTKNLNWGILTKNLVTLRVGIVLRRTFGNGKPFKNDEKCFLFHLKSSLRSQDL